MFCDLDSTASVGWFNAICALHFHLYLRGSAAVILLLLLYCRLAGHALRGVHGQMNALRLLWLRMPSAGSCAFCPGLVLLRENVWFGRNGPVVCVVFFFFCQMGL